jgi:putative peptidoglycan lipid II flippase
VSPGQRFVGSAKVVSALTLLSRIAGVARDMTLAQYFGASALMAAFTVAHRIPNLTRRLFGEGALSAAFIPIFSEHLHRGDGDQSARRLAGVVLGSLSLLLTVLVAAAIVALTVVNHFWATQPRSQLTIALTNVMMPFALLICCAALLGGILQVLGHFAAPAAAPIVLNVCIIIAAVYAGPIYGLDVVAVAVVLAGLIQLVMLQAVLARRRFVFRWRVSWRDAGLRRVAVLMGPMIIGLAAVQLNTLADSLIAFFLIPNPGAPAVIYYAERLYEFPLGVFSIALATAIFPAMAIHAARQEQQAFSATLHRGLRLVLFVGLAATVGLILIRQPLVELLFQRGRFTAAASQRVAWTLLFYAAGVWAYGLVHIAVRGHYALQDSRTPMRVSLAMIALNLMLNLILVFPMQEAGLALSTAICATIQSAWLLAALAKRAGGLCIGGLAVSAARSAGLVAAMAVACLAVDWFVRSQGLSTLWQVIAIAGTGGIVFLGLGVIFRVPEAITLIWHSREDQISD